MAAAVSEKELEALAEAVAMKVWSKVRRNLERHRGTTGRELQDALLEELDEAYHA